MPELAFSKNNKYKYSIVDQISLLQTLIDLNAKIFDDVLKIKQLVCEEDQENEKTEILEGNSLK